MRDRIRQLAFPNLLIGGLLLLVILAGWGDVAWVGVVVLVVLDLLVLVGGFRLSRQPPAGPQPGANDREE